MKLIGMLDSPYVRRVAISLQWLGIRFEHQSLSVFGGFEEFQRINPLVKAPTLICDDGEVLIDSSLILQYAEAMASSGRHLMPSAVGELQHALRVIGLALAACEKSVQIVYERKLRPVEKQHAPWVERVTGQLPRPTAGRNRCHDGSSRHQHGGGMDIHPAHAGGRRAGGALSDPASLLHRGRNAARVCRGAVRFQHLSRGVRRTDEAHIR
jgi:hypothetical protein